MAKTFRDIIKYNPYHDERGRFASASGASGISVGMGVVGATAAGGKRTQLESTLAEVESKNKSLDYEVATIINPSNGKTLFSKDGNGSSVTFNSSEAREIRGMILTHNHPEEIIFSPTDVATAYSLKTIRATTPSGKVYELSNVNDRDFVFAYRDKYMAARSESFKKMGIPDETYDRDLKGQQRKDSFSYISDSCSKWLSENSSKYRCEYNLIEEGC